MMALMVQRNNNHFTQFLPSLKRARVIRKAVFACYGQGFFAELGVSFIAT
jgi:hypothetical protein